MEDKYLWLIRTEQRKEQRDHFYPRDQLGVADRLIINMVVRKNARIFQEYTGEVNINPPLFEAIAQDLRTFGFDPYVPWEKELEKLKQGVRR